MSPVDLQKTNIGEGEQAKSNTATKLPTWAAETKVTDTRAQPWKELSREETVAFGDGSDKVDILKGREVKPGSIFLGSLAA